MTDENLTKDQLVEELARLRHECEALNGQTSAAMQAEETMWESQVALSALLNNLPGIAYRSVIDADGRKHVEFVSAGCKDLTGHDPSALIENPQFFREVLILPEDRPAVAARIQQALDEHRPYELEYRITTASGKTKWLWERGSTVLGSDGSNVAQEGFICDITERVQATNELRQRRDRLDQKVAERTAQLEETKTELEKELRRHGKRCSIGAPGNGGPAEADDAPERRNKEMTMLDLAKKGLYLGLGLAHYTKDKIDEFAAEFAERAKLSEEEGRKFAEYLNQESKKARDDMRSNVECMVEKAVSKMPCMSRVAALEARVDELEQQLKATVANADEAPATPADDDESEGDDADETEADDSGEDT